nr:hypothetical protein [Tanacetum cinerariifolium]
MAAPVISNSSNVSVESVGSSFPRVILIGSIFVEVSVTPEVEAAAIASPAGVLELDTHSSSEVDPLESSPPPVSIAPMVSHFLCSTDSKSNIEIPERHVSHTTSTPEIPAAPILPAPSAIVAPPSEFPLTPVVAPPRIHQSLSGHSSSDHSLSGHTPPDITDADSSTPPRFTHPPLTRTPRCSEAYLRWRSALLSTMYPPTTSESSTGDSSFESSAGPSRKRCRSPAAIMTSSIHSTRALVPSRVDLLPPRKRFRDSISPEDSVDEDIDTDVLEDIEADATTVEVMVDRDVETRIDVGTIEVGVDMDAGIDIPDGMRMPDAVERLEKLEAGQLIASGERADLSDRTWSLEQENLKVRALFSIDRDWVDSLRRHMVLSQEEFRQVMAAPVISISSDVSVESVGSSFPRVIFIGSIFVEVPVTPEVEAAAIASPVGVLELDTHSSSEADPLESSPPPISIAPMVSHFLCSTDSKSDIEIPERHVSPTTSTPEIPAAPILPAPSAIVAPPSEFSLAPVVAPPGIRRRRAFLIRPGEDIPIGRLYRTHPAGPCKALAVRKSVRPLPSYRLALSSDHSLSGHTPPDITDVDSSTPPRFTHPPLTRTPRCSEAYLHWRSALLSTMYPPTTSESSTGDSSFESSAGPSRKRCRSPAAIVTLSIHSTRALVPSRVDLLPPRKRFRDSISPEDSVEEDIDMDV